MVVIAIIAILAGMLLPALGAVKETGKQANCTNNLKQMGTAFVTYENDYSKMPYGDMGNDDCPYGDTTTDDSGKNSSGPFEVLRQCGLDEPKSFYCPSTTSVGWAQAEKGPMTPGTFSYGYFTNGEQGISTSTCGPSSTIVADAQPNSVWNHDKKGAYLRIDSSVSRPGGVSWRDQINTNNGYDDNTEVDNVLSLLK